LITTLDADRSTKKQHKSANYITAIIVKSTLYSTVRMHHTAEKKLYRTKSWNIYTCNFISKYVY